MNFSALLGAIITGVATLFVLNFYIHYIKTGEAIPDKNFGHLEYIVSLIFFGGILLAAISSL